MRKGGLPGQGTTPMATPAQEALQALQALRREERELLDVHCYPRTAPSSEAEAWTWLAHSGKKGHVKPAGLVTLNQAKANLGLPALVLCLSCSSASLEGRNLSLLSPFGGREGSRGYTGVRHGPFHQELCVSGDRASPSKDCFRNRGPGRSRPQK